MGFNDPQSSQPPLGSRQAGKLFIPRGPLLVLCSDPIKEGDEKASRAKGTQTRELPPGSGLGAVQEIHPLRRGGGVESSQNVCLPLVNFRIAMDQWLSWDPHFSIPDRVFSVYVPSLLSHHIWGGETHVSSSLVSRSRGAVIPIRMTAPLSLKERLSSVIRS